MARWLDSATAPHHCVRVAPPSPWVAPHPVIVRWTPAIAAVRGPEASYEGIVLTLKSSDAIRLYDARGLVAKLDSREIGNITESE
jgi:hypothetical protein